MRLGVAVFVSVGLQLGALAQTRPTAHEQFAQLQKESQEAREAKDYVKYRTVLLKMREFLDGSAASAYRLARVEALLGNKTEALRWLALYAEMGQGGEPDKDPAMQSVAGSPEFKALLGRMRKNSEPVERSKPAFVMTEPALLTEDINYDSRTKAFYISSILKKKIVRAVDGGTVSDFIGEQPWPIFALAVDSARGVLWATTAAMPNFEVTPKADWGKSALLKLELSSGKQLARFDVPTDGAEHVLGDMTLDGKGGVIVSDGQSGGVYRLAAGEKSLELLSTEFISPQTPAMHPDGKHVFVPDYSRGIGLLNLSTKKVTWLKHPEAMAISGIDGMYFYKNELLASQNGTGPARVVRMRLNRKLDTVVDLQVIESGTPTLGDPTHGVVVGDSFYYIANSGWSELDDNGKVQEGHKLTNAAVKKVILGQ